MYISGFDMVAITIALVALTILVITIAIANARITRSRDIWRRDYYDLQNYYEKQCQCSECN